MVRTQRRGNGDKTKQTCIHSFFGGGAARSEQAAPQLAVIDLAAAPAADNAVVRASLSNAARQPPSTAVSDRRVVLKLDVQSTGIVHAILRPRYQPPDVRGAKKQRAILEEQRAFRQEWITCEQGVEHKRKHWLRFDSEQRLLFCDACIKFGKN